MENSEKLYGELTACLKAVQYQPEGELAECLRALQYRLAGGLTACLWARKRQLEEAQAVKPANSPDLRDRLFRDASRRPITPHVLSDMDEYVREIYCTALCSVVLACGNTDIRIRYFQMLFIARCLYRSCGIDFLSRSLRRSTKIDSGFFDDFTRCLKTEYAIHFALDAAVLCFLSGEGDRAGLDITAKYMSLLDLTEEDAATVSQLCRAVITRRRADFLQIRNVSLWEYLGYMEDLSDE